MDASENTSKEIHNLLLTILLNFENLHLIVQDFAGVSDVDSCLHFVTGKHPKFDFGFSDCSNSFTNIILKLVLDSGCSQKIEAVFQLSHSCLNFQFLISYRTLRLIVIFRPLSILKLVDDFMA